MRAAFGIPRDPAAATPASPAQTPPAPPAQPSDDPAVTGRMPKLPTAPDLSNAPQVGLYKQYQDALAKQAALKAPDPNQLRPHWYDRLLGGVVGAASNDAGAGGNVTNRRLINANREYQAQEAPLQKQLANIRGGAELAKGAAEVPQQGFENQMQIEKAGENQAQLTEQQRAHKASEATAEEEAQTGAKGEAAREVSEAASAKTAQQKADQEATEIAQTGKYQQGELANRNAALALDKQKFEASISNFPDLKSLDAEEKADNAALDKAQQASANQIKEDYKGVWGSVKHLGATPEDALKKDQANFDAQRAAHAQAFAARRAALTGGQGAPGAGTAGTPAPPAKGFTRITASDGSVHDIPSNKLDAARARDPKLVVSQ